MLMMCNRACELLYSGSSRREPSCQPCQCPYPHPLSSQLASGLSLASRAWQLLWARQARQKESAWPLMTLETLYWLKLVENTLGRTTLRHALPVLPEVLSGPEPHLPRELTCLPVYPALASFSFMFWLPIPLPWDQLPNQFLILKSLSQGLFLGETKLRQIPWVTFNMSTNQRSSCLHTRCFSVLN